MSKTTIMAAACAMALGGAAFADEIGKADFQQYCATCHGLDATGGGDLTQLMTVKVPDLTQIAAANEGVEEDPLAQQKLDFLSSVGRDQTVDFPCYADRYPVEMLEYLRLMMMTEEDTRGKELSDFDFSRTIF